MTETKHSVASPMYGTTRRLSDIQQTTDRQLKIYYFQPLLTWKRYLGLPHFKLTSTVLRGTPVTISSANVLYRSLDQILNGRNDVAAFSARNDVLWGQIENLTLSIIDAQAYSIFIRGTILQNFIPIGFETTTELYVFEEVALTKRSMQQEQAQQEQDEYTCSYYTWSKKLLYVIL